MEHESFENPHIARILNESFVSIKVDREQRPDLDHVYMQAVQMMTGSGGWPMSLFLTPATRPFYGGTYWPPESRWGRPGFAQVLQAVIDAWKNNRSALEQQGEEMAGHLVPESVDPGQLSLSDLQKADALLRKIADRVDGGFGAAPKFPHATDLQLLMRLDSRWPDPDRRAILTTTLDRMARGGIYDHLAGGFARYSVDNRWLVPHFEKMLYDNALLASTYLDAFRMTDNDQYASVASQTLEYLLSSMRDTAGGFYSAEDADSEGVEGKFYVWTKSEVLAVLGAEDGEDFCRCYDVTQAGNFEGHSILNLPRPLDQWADQAHVPRTEWQDRMAECRRKLLEVRSQRIRPGLDDKVLVAWNALAIEAFAKGYMDLGEPRYLEAARQCASFLMDQLTDQDGRLLHVWRRGRAEIPGFLDDYAYLANGLITLFEADHQAGWLVEAQRLLQVLEGHFRDPSGGYFYCANDAEALIARTKDYFDHSIPSGNAMAATAMIRLSQWTDAARWCSRSESLLRTVGGLLTRSPGAFGQWWIALDWLLGPTQQAVCFLPSSADTDWLDLARDLRQPFLPRSILALIRPGEDSRGVPEDLVRNRQSLSDSEPTLYWCEGQTCQAPLVGRSAILEFLFETAQSGSRRT
jgi:hypothetical protein